MLWERHTGSHPPDPRPDQVPRGVPDLAPEDDTTLRLTFVGHATWLIQAGGMNVLTDPHLTKRASPFARLGPARFTPPGISLDGLPRVDAVVLSHDHYDHLDRPSVVGLHRRFGDGLTWITPLGYADWFARLGVRNVVEMDWDERREVILPDAASEAGRLSVTALPTQHWTRRGRAINNRLWASYVLDFQLPVEGGAGEAAHGRRRVYFGGDSGYFPGYRDWIRRHAPFDALLMPVGAYEPRWFMKFAHMNPEDAVQAYRDLGAEGHFLAMHWGTFRLTFEDPLEPPERVRAAWRAAGLPDEYLHTPGIGGTVVLE
jgi:N-acyl-phosphatidylethanolamine-hydrolysing phospholipase D